MTAFILSGSDNHDELQKATANNYNFVMLKRPKMTILLQMERRHENGLDEKHYYFNFKLFNINNLYNIKPGPHNLSRGTLIGN